MHKQKAETEQNYINPGWKHKCILKQKEIKLVK